MYTAELYAILKAMKICNTSVQPRNKHLMCSDSMSALQGIIRMYTDNSLISEIRREAALSGDNMALAWIPPHVNTEDNERADQTTKQSLTRDVVEEMRIPYRDLMACVRQTMSNELQDEWLNGKGTMKELKRTTRWLSTRGMKRRGQRGNEDRLNCICGARRSTYHLLERCDHYSDARQEFQVSIQCLGDDQQANLRFIEFLRETDLVLMASAVESTKKNAKNAISSSFTFNTYLGPCLLQ